MIFLYRVRAIFTACHLTARLRVHVEDALEFCVALCYLTSTTTPFYAFIHLETFSLAEGKDFRFLAPTLFALSPLRCLALFAVLRLI
ncbi:hypothetical protein B0H13DRAFT_2333181 [Mycena leptocephala]|nr:hypothetical protein B0H13DRAFT_2375016 [Mycena leptocephala]KAJ7906740.1 hypothetical protein B0H13DRAFT_2333181 [Mycena leptocephala]